MLQNVKLTHYLSTILTILSVGLGGEVAAGKAGSLPVSPAVLGTMIMALYAVNYVLGLLSPSIIPTTNLRAARSAKLVDSVAIIQTVTSLLVLVVIGGMLLSACIKPPTPAQQAQDAEALTVCIAQYFGLPVVAVAAACTGNEITVAEDAIADFEYGIEKATGSLPDAGMAITATVKLPAIYSTDVEIQAHLEKLWAGVVLPPDAGH